MSRARFSPSSAPIWGNCSGSTQFEKLDQQQSDRTQEGTTAHALAADCLINGKNPEEGTAKEMAEGVQLYLDEIRGVMEANTEKSMVVEHAVTAPRIHADCRGTVDAAYYTGDTLYIWDFKYGHSAVDPFQNLQIVNYIEGLAGHYLLKPTTKISARIVQPFAYDGRGPVREWATNAQEVAVLVEQLRQKAQEADTAPRCRTGKHCTYCPGRVRCTALRKVTHYVLDVMDAPLAFDEATGHDLARERVILQNAETAIKSRLKAIEDDLYYRISKGEGIAGLAIEPTQGRLTWKVEPEQAIALARALGVDIEKIECYTPTQTRGMLPAKKRKAFDIAISNITEKKTTLKLVNVKDTAASRVFGKI